MSTSTPLARALRVGLAAAATLAAGAAFGQSWQATCTGVGFAAPEPLGREGYALQVSNAVCRIAGGPLDGGIETQSTIWEIDRTNFKMVANNAVARSVTGRVVAVSTGGTLQLQVQDGRPVGWTGSGTGVFGLATGPAASLAGKKYSWTGRSTGPNVYIVDVKAE